MWQVVIGGILGGFVYSLRHASNHRFRLPGRDAHVELGVLGDLAIGAAAALAAFATAANLNIIALRVSDIAADVDKAVAAVAFGIVAGFAGIRLIAELSNRLVAELKAVEEKVDTVERRTASFQRLVRAGSLRESGRYLEALREYDIALELDPSSELAAIDKAKTLRKLNRLDEAIGILTSVARKESDNAARAIYNRACYHALRGERAVAMTDLRDAIGRDPYYLELASQDPDFQEMLEMSEFQALVRPTSNPGK